ncbi:MAG TPA: hypothetical protein VMF12_14360 [Xanthobacteraceae bacterium]|nr:hypothetical protein [Xanthobacteraceae bacterium]
MAVVQKQKPPSAGPKAIGQALRDLRASPESASVGGAQINLSAPLPVYRLGLNQLDEGNFLAKAAQVGWRYLMEGVAGGVAYADVRETGGAAKFTGLAQNENAIRLLDAAHLAQKVAVDIDGDCEARILDIPAVYVSAVWLSCANPLFIPYIYPPRFGSGKIEVQRDFLKQLQQLAAAAKRQFGEREERTELR